MKNITLVLLVLILIGLLAYSGESINSKISRWRAEVNRTEDIERLLEIRDSMNIYREYVDDSLYKDLNNKISQY